MGEERVNAKAEGSRAYRQYDKQIVNERKLE